MLNIGIVIFRETLEISLIIGIIIAATRGIEKSIHWMLLGLGLGAVLATIIAYYVNLLSVEISEQQQDAFNIIILATAIILIAWTVIWMRNHSRSFANNIKQIEQSILSGKMPLYVISGVVTVAMLRESIEIIIFCLGIKAASQISNLELIKGVILGILSGGLIGSMLYFGLIKISRKYFFSVTSWLMILLAAGMAAQIPNFINLNNNLAFLSLPLWDSSWLIAENSIIGKIIHIITGYTARPSSLQLIFYIATLSFISFASKFVQLHNQPTSK